MKRFLAGKFGGILETVFLGLAFVFLLPTIPSYDQYPDWFPKSIAPILFFLGSRFIRYYNMKNSLVFLCVELIGFLTISYAFHEAARLLFEM